MGAEGEMKLCTTYHLCDPQPHVHTTKRIKGDTRVHRCQCSRAAAPTCSRRRITSSTVVLRTMDACCIWAGGM